MTFQIHELKCWPEFFDAIEDGDKTFEVRVNDRGFQKGDFVILRRLEEIRSGCWKEECHYDLYYDLRRKITYVLTGGQLGIEPGYVVLGLSRK